MSKWFQDFSHRASPTVRLFENPVTPSLARSNSIVVQFTTAGAFLSSLSFLFWNGSSFRAFFLVVHQPCNAETHTCLQPYNPFHFCRIGTRADANISTRRSRTNTSQIISARVEEWTHGYFCLGYFSLPRHTSTSWHGWLKKAWRQCVLVFVHDLGFRAWDYTCLLANTALFSFHW